MTSVSKTCGLALLLCGVVVAKSPELSIDLQTGNVSGSPATTVNGFEWQYMPPASFCSSRCDLRGVLKLSFNNATRKRAQINLKFSSVVKGVSFHIVELDQNNSCANISLTSPKDTSSISRGIMQQEELRRLLCENASLRLSEVIPRDKNLTIYSEKKPANETILKPANETIFKPANESSQQRLHSEANYIGYEITISVKDKEVTADNGQKNLTLKAEKLFALKISSSSSAPTSSSNSSYEYVIYLGMNRMVDDPSPFSQGEGLCSAKISWHSE